MSLDMNDRNSQDAKLQYLKDTLSKIRQDVQSPPPENTPVEMKPLDLLDKYNLLQYQPDLEKRIQYWPEPIRVYLKKELLSYLYKTEQPEEEDLEKIDKLLDTAFFDLPNCGKDLISQEQWEGAMTSVAHELRRYYGRGKDDDEVPCWP